MNVHDFLYGKFENHLSIALSVKRWLRYYDKNTFFDPPESKALRLERPFPCLSCHQSLTCFSKGGDCHFSLSVNGHD